MYLFKTSGETYNSVIKNEKHAFKNKPKNWHTNELVLVSKNKSDCHNWEKQIQYIMRLDDIRRLVDNEAEKFWPGNAGRWKYLVICKDTKLIDPPFNLDEILGEEVKPYLTIQTFGKITPKHEKKIKDYFQKVRTL